MRKQQNQQPKYSLTLALGLDWTTNMRDGAQWVASVEIEDKWMRAHKIWRLMIQRWFIASFLFYTPGINYLFYGLYCLIFFLKDFSQLHQNFITLKFVIFMRIWHQKDTSPWRIWKTKKLWRRKLLKERYEYTKIEWKIKIHSDLDTGWHCHGGRATDHPSAHCDCGGGQGDHDRP